MNYIQKIKRFNGIIYYGVFICLMLYVIDNVFNTRLFTIISQSHFWNFAYYIFLTFLIFSNISLINKNLFFANIPPILYVIYVLSTVLLFVLNMNEDLIMF